VTFSNNRADGDGGVLYESNYSSIIFHGNSTVSFTNNSASSGGAVFSKILSVVSFGQDTTINFTRNAARSDGGVMYAELIKKILTSHFMGTRQ